MATTNFFRQVAALKLTGDLQVMISTGEENKCIVSVMLLNDKCGDKAKQLIPPLVFRGDALKIDETFFQDVKSPMEQTSALMTNMESYLKQVEIAKAQSAMEKSKASKATSTAKTETKQERYNATMQKVNELENQGNFKDAWMKVPLASEFPEHAEEIKKRKSSLSAKFEPDLFNNPIVPQQAEEPKKEKDPFFPDYANGEIEEEWREEKENENI